MNTANNEVYMKKLSIFFLLSNVAFAQIYQDIYPFKPYETERITSSAEKLTETQDYVWNSYEMDKKRLTTGKTKVQPWAGSYWPLHKGMVASDYHDIKSIAELSWKANARRYDRRAETIHPKIYGLS